MTVSPTTSARHVIGIGLAVTIGLIIAGLWFWMVPWIEQTPLTELATLIFVGLAALVLSLGEMLWMRLHPSSH